MNKIFFLLILLLNFSFLSYSQAYEGTIEYNKKKQAAIVIDYAYPAEAVENAIVQKMERMGYKGKEEKGIFNKDKGFLIYKGAFVTEISDRSMDYIIKIEQKSRREKDINSLYLIINKDASNAISTFSSGELSRAKDFLNDLLPDVEAANLELQIRDQEEIIVKSEKKLRTLRDNQKDMENKIRKLEDDLKTNDRDQKNTETDIDNQRKALDALKGKRRN